MVVLRPQLDWPSERRGRPVQTQVVGPFQHKASVRDCCNERGVDAPQEVILALKVSKLCSLSVSTNPEDLQRKEVFLRRPTGYNQAHYRIFYW